MEALQLFKQLPVGRIRPSAPPFDAEARSEYPALADRFEVLDTELVPAFLELDGLANAAQTRYRRYRLALLLGAALTTIAGAILAAVGDTAWPGAVVAVLGLATTAISNLYRRDQPLVRYLNSRAGAEQLRSVYFRYLSGVGGQDRQALEEEVADITHPGSGEARDV